ncbi:MAG: YicC family protein [Crocinitomicaceae bacterium]|nr:YicC family protein [Crocinitomicaceae bacterium]
MISSMTGFGKAESVYNNKKITVEIRTLNSKSIEIKTKIPTLYKDLDLHIRKLLTKNLIRGKIDCNIYIEDTSGEKATTINKEKLNAYYKELKQINKGWKENSTDYLSVILRIPDVFTKENSSIDKKEEEIILELIKRACENTTSFRLQEGKAIEKEFNLYLSDINDRLKKIEPFEKTRKESQKKKITQGLSILDPQKINNDRLEQELIYYIEKLDISEEKSRLKNHLMYFSETMKFPNTGKKLGFISQEIGREINTLGSKGNHAEIQKMVVEMKDALEKIKEQVLNTL